MAAQIPGVAALSPEGCQTILADQLPLELGQPPGDADHDVAVALCATLAIGAGPDENMCCTHPEERGVRGKT